MSDYRKLLVWQKAKDLAVEVYGAIGASAISRDFGLRDQMLRAVVSIASNIAEGDTRDTPADRAHFLSIARSSCAELETQLIIAAESGLIAAAKVQRLLATTGEISRMLYALRARIRSETRSS